MTATKAIPVKRLLSAQAYQLIDREIAKYPADQKQSAVMEHVLPRNRNTW